MPKLLLVEDDINLRDIYSARFMAEQYTVITAADGEEALATAVRERPDLIILDVMMPKISGFDVLDILRSTPETKETKIIMMTALSQETDKARGEALGVNKYLIKSQVTLEDVVSSVKEILGGSTVPAGVVTSPVVAPSSPTATNALAEPEVTAPQVTPGADAAVTTEPETAVTEPDSSTTSADMDEPKMATSPTEPAITTASIAAAPASSNDSQASTGSSSSAPSEPTPGADTSSSEAIL